VGKREWMFRGMKALVTGPLRMVIWKCCSGQEPTDVHSAVPRPPSEIYFLKFLPLLRGETEALYSIRNVCPTGVQEAKKRSANGMRSLRTCIFF